MASYHNVSIKITAYSPITDAFIEKTKELFLLINEPEEHLKHSYDSFKVSDKEILLSYSDSFYYHSYSLFYCCIDLAKQVKNLFFDLYAFIWNEGSGENYSEELYATYKFGTLSYQYIGSDHDNEEPFLNAVWPRSDFVADIKSTYAIPNCSNGYDFASLRVEVPDSRKRLLTKEKNKKNNAIWLKSIFLDEDNSTRGGNFDICKGIALYYYDDAYHYFDRAYPSHALALNLSLISTLANGFLDDSIPNLYANDKNVLLRKGIINSIYSYHVFKSFIWTTEEYCKKNRKKIGNISISEIIDVAKFIKDCDGLNWEAAAKNSKRIGAVLLPKSETEYTYIEYGIDGTTRKSWMSYFSLIDALVAFAPHMIKIFDYLVSIEEIDEKDNILIDVLQIWSAFSLACRNPFDVITSSNTDVATDEPILESTKLKKSGDFYLFSDICVATTAEGRIEFPEGVKRVAIPKLRIFGAKEYYDADTILYPLSFEDEKRYFMIGADNPLLISEPPLHIPRKRQERLYKKSDGTF